MQYETPLGAVIKGALAGLVGTAAMTGVVAATPLVLKSLGQEPPPMPKADDGSQPHDRMAEKVAEGVLDVPLDDEAKAAGGQLVHWAYGVGWGTAYGILQSSLHPPPLLHGAALGILLGGLAETVVPALRLAPPPHRRLPSQNVMQFVITLTFGLVTALVYSWLAPERKA